MFRVMEFTEVEFRILDLISEDAYGFVELSGANRNHAREARTHLFDLGYVSVETVAPDTAPKLLAPTEAHAAILDDKNWNAIESAVRYTAYRTDDGWSAYVRAYNEREPKSD